MLLDGLREPRKPAARAQQRAAAGDGDPFGARRRAPPADRADARRDDLPRLPAESGARLRRLGIAALVALAPAEMPRIGEIARAVRLWPSLSGCRC